MLSAPDADLVRRDRQLPRSRQSVWVRDVKLLATSIALLLIAGEAAAQEHVSTPPAEPQGHLWSWHLGTSSMFESNIDYDVEGVRSYGVVFDGGFDYRNHPSRPTFELSYGIAAHSYTQTSRWNRVSQNFRALYERRLSRSWRFGTLGEIALKGSSEDRDLADQYVIQPSVEYRFNARNRIRVYGAYRIRRFEEDWARNATNSYAGVELRQAFENGPQWRIGLRYEGNDTVESRYQYFRWTYSMEYQLPIGADDRLMLDVIHRSKRYGYRLVKIEEQKVPRVDQKWEPSLVWARTLGPGVELQLGYSRESLTSNHPDAGYEAHEVLLAVARRW